MNWTVNTSRTETARSAARTSFVPLRFKQIVLTILIIAVVVGFGRPAQAISVMTLQAQGEVQALKQNWILARRYFREALALDPGNPELILLTARTEAEMGNSAAAEELLRDGIDKIPKALLLLAQIKAKEGRWQAAANLLKKYEKAVPRDPKAMFLNALAAYYLGDYQTALKQGLSAGNLSPDEYKGPALLLAAQIKFRQADPQKAAKALVMAKPVISGTQGELLARDLQDLIDSRGEQKKRWWAHGWIDTLYTDNKSFISDRLRKKMLGSDLLGELLDNHKVVSGVVSYLKLNGAYNWLQEPFSASAGYVGTQQFAGQAKGKYRTDFGSQEVEAKLTSLHNLWIDGSKYIPLSKFSLEPGLEINTTLDLPGFGLDRIGVAVAPRSSFYFDRNRSATIYWRSAWSIDKSLPERSSVEWGPVFQMQYTGRSKWRFARATVGFGNKVVDNSDLSYSWQDVRFDTRLNPWKGLLFDLQTHVEQRRFSHRADQRVDSLVGFDSRIGWAFLEYRLIFQTLVTQTYQFSNNSKYSARVRQYGLRLGGAF